MIMFDLPYTTLAHIIKFNRLMFAYLIVLDDYNIFVWISLLKSKAEVSEHVNSSLYLLKTSSEHALKM